MLRCFRLFQRMFRRHRSPLMVKEVNANCEVGSGVSELLEATSVSKPRFRLAAALFLRQGGDCEAARHGGYAGQVLYIDRGGSESAARALLIVVDAGRFLSIDLGLGLL